VTLLFQVQESHGGYQVSGQETREHSSNCDNPRPTAQCDKHDQRQPDRQNHAQQEVRSHEQRRGDQILNQRDAQYHRKHDDPCPPCHFLGALHLLILTSI
jgi:hypothetical protein